MKNQGGTEGQGTNGKAGERWSDSGRVGRNRGKVDEQGKDGGPEKEWRIRVGQGRDGGVEE